MKKRGITDATRQKMSLAKKGRKLSDEHKKKISKSLKGRIISEEHKRKLSEAHKGKKKRYQVWNKGKRNVYSEETLVKMSKTRLGKRKSEDFKQKCSVRMREQWKNPIFREKTMEGMARYHKALSKDILIDDSRVRLQLRVWQRLATKIRKRDEYKCQNCPVTPAKIVHHILPWKLGGPDEEWNLMTVCGKCHLQLERQECFIKI